MDTGNYGIDMLDSNKDVVVEYYYHVFKIRGAICMYIQGVTYILELNGNQITMVPYGGEEEFSSILLEKS